LLDDPKFNHFWLSCDNYPLLCGIHTLSWLVITFDSIFSSYDKNSFSCSIHLSFIHVSFIHFCLRFLKEPAIYILTSKLETKIFQMYFSQIFYHSSLNILGSTSLKFPLIPKTCSPSGLHNTKEEFISKANGQRTTFLPFFKLPWRSLFFKFFCYHISTRL